MKEGINEGINKRKEMSLQKAVDLKVEFLEEQHPCPLGMIC